MSIKNIALLVIVIGIVLLIVQTNESFVVANMGSVIDGEVCIHDTGAGTNGSTQCLSESKCVHSDGYLVNALLSVGTCKKCNNTDAGQGLGDPFTDLSLRGKKCSF